MEKPTVKEETFLQCILGVDKGNPSITVYRDLSEGKLHVYYGHELFEVVEDDREQVEFKLDPIRKAFRAGGLRFSATGGPAYGWQVSGFRLPALPMSRY